MSGRLELSSEQLRVQHCSLDLPSLTTRFRKATIELDRREQTEPKNFRGLGIQPPHFSVGDASVSIYVVGVDDCPRDSDETIRAVAPLVVVGNRFGTLYDTFVGAWRSREIVCLRMDLWILVRHFDGGHVINYCSDVHVFD